jgi:hypothetical protein
MEGMPTPMQIIKVGSTESSYALTIPRVYVARGTASQWEIDWLSEFKDYNFPSFEPSSSILFSIPIEVLDHIRNFLDPQEKLNLSLTCKTARSQPSCSCCYIYPCVRETERLMKEMWEDRYASWVEDSWEDHWYETGPGYLTD